MVALGAGWALHALALRRLLFTGRWCSRYLGALLSMITASQRQEIYTGDGGHGITAYLLVCSRVGLVTVTMDYA